MTPQGCQTQVRSTLNFHPPPLQVATRAAAMHQLVFRQPDAMTLQHGDTLTPLRPSCDGQLQRQGDARCEPMFILPLFACRLDALHPHAEPLGVEGALPECACQAGEALNRANIATSLEQGADQVDLLRPLGAQQSAATLSK